MEVKGCTLERDGIGYFPDAPTERGIKHLEELAAAVKAGYHTALCFVITMPKVTQVFANVETHKAFGEAMDAKERAGVKIIYLPCKVEKDEVEFIEQRIPFLAGKKTAEMPEFVHISGTLQVAKVGARLYNAVS